jgi:hypothetical protein
MPSYMGLGFEQRDRHPAPAPNEHYTKLYVFQIDQGPKATTGPYQWGQNLALFQELDRLRQFAEAVLPSLVAADTHWLQGPATTEELPALVWTQAASPRYLCAANLSADRTVEVKLRMPSANLRLATSADYKYGEVHYEQSEPEHVRITLGPEGLLVVAIH